MKNTWQIFDFALLNGICLPTTPHFLQAKPTYGGWLLLAPEGTNFDNPLHRSRVSMMLRNAESPFPHGVLRRHTVCRRFRGLGPLLLICENLGW